MPQTPPSQHDDAYYTQRHQQRQHQQHLQDEIYYVPGSGRRTTVVPVPRNNTHDAHAQSHSQTQNHVPPLEGGEMKYETGPRRGLRRGYDGAYEEERRFRGSEERGELESRPQWENSLPALRRDRLEYEGVRRDMHKSPDEIRPEMTAMRTAVRTTRTMPREEKRKGGCLIL